MRQLLLLAALAAAPTLAAAQPQGQGQTQPADDLGRGVQLRLAGRPADAIPLLANATRAHPEDADAWLNLGLAYSATGRLKEAEQALDRAAALSPNYADVQVARARLAYFRQDLDEAQRRLAPALAAYPDHAEAQALAREITAARAAAAAPWRLDLSYTHGRLGAGLPDAETAIAAIFRRFAQGGGAGVSIDHTRQFDQTDTYVEGAFAGRHAYMAVGGTSNAHFRPKLKIAGGAYADAVRWQGWTFQPLVDASWARYPVGEVRSVTPGVDVARGEALLMQLRWTNVVDENDDYQTGYSLRGQWRPTGSAIIVSGGFGDGPETSEGRTLRTRSVSAGLAWEANTRTTLRLSAEHQSHRAYDRDDVTLGATQRF